MTFTVVVERKSPDEQFTADGIKLFHQECGGGQITRTGDEGHTDWKLHCRRCRTSAFVEVSKDGTALLMKTAIDGESRQIKKRGHWDDDILAIART